MWEAVLQHSIDHHVRFYWSQSFILRPKYEWLLTTVDWPVFLCGWSHKPRTHLHRHSHKMDTTLIKPYSYQFTDLYIMSDVCDTAMYATNGGARAGLDGAIAPSETCLRQSIMEGRFRHWKKKGNCDFFSHKSDLLFLTIALFFI